MIVDIEKVIVKDRIRKDFGDIQELADDIKMNGLINPPVVNKNYELLAGERRLRACKELGWNQVEVRMMDTRDAEHELNVEISENDVRKGFTKSERVDYMKRLLRIEQAKAKERQILGEKSREGGRSDEKTAEQFGVSSNTMRKEISIVENKDLLDPSDFADWDEGKLSTNKAFQKVKTSLEQAKRQHIIDSERIKLLEKQKPQVIEKEVVREVIPDDYEELQDKARRIDGYQKDYVDMRKRYEEVTDKLRTSEREKEKLIEEMKRPETERKEKITKSALAFCGGVANFIEKYGGYDWLIAVLDDMDESERSGYIKAVDTMDDWIASMRMKLKGEITI